LLLTGFSVSANWEIGNASEHFMKKLVLIRHAKSSWDHSAIPDIYRPLNERGYRDAPAMGKLLAEAKLFPDRLVSSPAIRAYSTAMIIAQELNFPLGRIELTPRLYETTEAEYFDVISEADEKQNIQFLFGHNFTISNVLSRLVGEHVEELPTCGIAVVELSLKKWSDLQPGSGILNAYITPKKKE
jgi:phosphohistidine phosphatase